VGIVEVVTSIPKGSLRSYTWVAVQLGYPGAQGAQAAGQAIARETLRRFPNPQSDARVPGGDFPWWRVVGAQGEVRTVRESQDWYERQVLRLQAEEHTLVPALEGDEGLRVSPLPKDFE
jgi:alkylated DNA nucleotide flippase Atl1